MNNENTSSTKRRRLLAWIVPICLLGIVLLFFKVYPNHQQPPGVTAVTSKPLSIDDVRWAFVSDPLPSTAPAQPLFPDRDATTISNLLKWIHQAQEVKTEKLQMPKRSEAVTVEMKDGSSVSVQYAWTCQSSKESNGNTSITCQAVTDRVMISNSKDNSKPTFAISKELYSFLQQASKSMPRVPYAVYPKSIKAGSTLRVEGNAWLTNKVIVSLLNGSVIRDKPVCSGEATPDHGHFELEIPCPQAKPGGYQLEYRGEKTMEMTFPISVTK